MDDRTKGNSPSWTTLAVGVLGAVLLWASLPPLGWWPLGWIAPVPWLWLARLPVLPGRRPYLALWFSGAVFWTATNHWLRLPHPATSLGWFALSFYLACYVPLIVGLARVAKSVGLSGISIVISGPVLWVAADQARAYVFSGFSMSSLCHSQYRQPEVIRCAEWCGEFGLTFLMVLVAASFSRMLPLERGGKWSFRWLLVVIAVAYLLLPEIESSTETARLQRIRIALIQGSIESEVKHDPTKPPLIYDNYLTLSKRALELDKDVQLIVWPETMFPYPYWIVGDDVSPAPGEDWTPDMLRRRAGEFRDLIALTARTLGKPLLLGVATAEFGRASMRGFNTALLVDAQGKPLGRYDKRHRVMFGEYIPLADWFPWLYSLTPLTGGIQAGREAESFTLGDVRLAPNICYESALARVIRRQMVELRGRGEEPDVLVNLTNDSWFRGSSELDLHLACGVFRAVEMRKPLVIAANTGLSAYIDQRGNIVELGPRRAEGALIANVEFRPTKPSLYLLHGDRLAWLCVAGAIILAAIGTYRRRRVSAAP
jgi:apolipoprotein N-acyltransferase